MSKFMFESSKAVRKSIFADFNFRQTRRAFTLIELLAIIAVIAIWLPWTLIKPDKVIA
jgi:hypothetical protein